MEDGNEGGEGGGAPHDGVHDKEDDRLDAETAEEADEEEQEEEDDDDGEDDEEDEDEDEDEDGESIDADEDEDGEEGSSRLRKLKAMSGRRPKVFGMRADEVFRGKRGRKRRSLLERVASDDLPPRPKRPRTGRIGNMPLPAALASTVGRAHELYVKGRLADAIRELSEVTRQAPRHPEAYTSLAHIHEDAGDAANALQFYVIAAKLRQRDAHLWKKVLALSQELQKDGPSLEALRRLQRIDPGDVDVGFAKIDMLERLQRHKLAGECCAELSKAAPGPEHGLCMRASINFGRAHGCAQQSIDALLVGLSRCVGSALVQRFFLADAPESAGLLRLRKLGLAGRVALEESSGDVATLMPTAKRLQQLLMKAGDFPLACGVCKMLTQYLTMARTKQQLGGDGASGAGDRLKVPIDIAVRHGVCLVRSGEAADGQKWFGALQIPSDEADAAEVLTLRLEVAEAQYACGRLAEAWSHYDGALGLPLFTEAPGDRLASTLADAAKEADPKVLLRVCASCARLGDAHGGAQGGAGALGRHYRADIVLGELLRERPHHTPLLALRASFARHSGSGDFKRRCVPFLRDAIAAVSGRWQAELAQWRRRCARGGAAGGGGAFPIPGGEAQRRLQLLVDAMYVFRDCGEADMWLAIAAALLEMYAFQHGVLRRREALRLQEEPDDGPSLRDLLREGDEGLSQRIRIVDAVENMSDGAKALRALCSATAVRASVPKVLDAEAFGELSVAAAKELSRRGLRAAAERLSEELTGRPSLLSPKQKRHLTKAPALKRAPADGAAASPGPRPPAQRASAPSARLFDAAMAAGEEESAPWNALAAALRAMGGTRDYDAMRLRIGKAYKALEGSKAPLSLLMGNFHLGAARLPQALKCYLEALRGRPADPLPPLCVGAALLRIAGSRKVADREDVIAKALVMLHEYARRRSGATKDPIEVLADDDASAEVAASSMFSAAEAAGSARAALELPTPEDGGARGAGEGPGGAGAHLAEVMYNLGRAHQEMELDYVAVWYYKEVLRIGGDRPDFVVKQAAVNLAVVYRKANYASAVRRILDRYLTYA